MKTKKRYNFVSFFSAYLALVMFFSACKQEKSSQHDSKQAPPVETKTTTEADKGADFSASVFKTKRLQRVVREDELLVNKQEDFSRRREINVVFYNLWNFLTMERRGKVAFKPEHEIREVLAMLKKLNPDILGVCEIGGKKETLLLQKRLKDAGIDLPNVVWMMADDPTRSLALLSKFPISNTAHQKNLAFDLDGVWMPFGRGILDATLKINPSYELRILLAHLKSKREVEYADQAQLRLGEARLLRRHAEEILATAPATNLLIMGDFNDYIKQPPLLALSNGDDSEILLKDIWLEDKDGYRWTHHWAYNDVYSRIDYAFVSNPLFREVSRQKSRIGWTKNWRTASDHRPLLLVIKPKDIE